jgi:hypothetical protein
MATLLQQEQEKEKQENQSNMQTAGPATSTGAVSPVVQPAQTGAGSTPYSSKQSTSPAANLRRYIEANQTQLGQNVARDVESDLEKAEGKFQNVQSTFEQNKSNLENLYNTQAQQFQQQVQQEQYQPILDDQNQFQTFQQLRDRDVSGIDEFGQQYQTGLQELNPVQQQAQQRVQQFGTEQGRFNLLQQMFAQPGYSAGEQSLDQLLVQTDPNLRNLSTDLTRRTRGVDKNVSELQSRFEELNPAFRQQATDVQQQLTEGLMGGEQSLEDALTQAAQTRTQADDQMLEGIRERFQSNNLTIDDLDFLGISSDAAPRLIINDFGEIEEVLDRGEDYGIGDVATQEDINRYNALRQLAGGQISSQFDLTLPEEEQIRQDDLYNIRTLTPFQQAYENYKASRGEFEDFITEDDRQTVSGNMWGAGRDIGMWGDQNQGWNIDRVLDQYQGLVRQVDNPYLNPDGSMPRLGDSSGQGWERWNNASQFNALAGDLRGIGQASDFSLDDIQNYIDTRLAAGGTSTTARRRNRLYGETSQVLEDLYNRSRAAQTLVNRLQQQDSEKAKAWAPELYDPDAASTQEIQENWQLFNEDGSLAPTKDYWQPDDEQENFPTVTGKGLT